MFVLQYIVQNDQYCRFILAEFLERAEVQTREALIFIGCCGAKTFLNVVTGFTQDQVNCCILDEHQRREIAEDVHPRKTSCVKIEDTV